MVGVWDFLFHSSISSIFLYLSLPPPPKKFLGMGGPKLEGSGDHGDVLRYADLQVTTITHRFTD